MLASLALAVPEHPILLAGTARPGIPEDWRADLERLDQASRVELSRLGPKDLAHLLRDAFQSKNQTRRFPSCFRRDEWIPDPGLTNNTVLATLNLGSGPRTACVALTGSFLRNRSALPYRQIASALADTPSTGFAGGTLQSCA